MCAPNRQSAEEEIERLVEESEARHPRARECLVKDRQTLLSFFDLPAEHWPHLRTTNPIESPFATVKTRTQQTKTAGSCKAGLALAFKLALAARDHWRRVNVAHPVASVRAGAPSKMDTKLSLKPVSKSRYLTIWPKRSPPEMADRQHMETSRKA